MTSPHQQRLREALVDAFDRDLARERRRRRGLLVGAVAAVGSGIAALVAVLAPSPAAADVDITISNGRVEVVVTDLDSTAQDVRDAAAKAGIDVRVEGVPVGPSLTGRFVQVVVDGDPQFQIQRTGVTGDGFTGFSLDEDWPGQLLIVLGEDASAGELYERASDAFAPGEPLNCRALRGQRLAAIGSALSGFDVSVQGVSLGVPTPLDEAVDGELAGQYVVNILALSSDRLLVMVQPDRAAPQPLDPSC